MMTKYDRGMEMGVASPALSYEDELVQRYKAGDEDAREELFGRLLQPAYLVARARLDNEADAEDAAQDGLLKVAAHLDSFEGRSSFKTWARRVVKNAVFDAGRKLKRHPTLSRHAFEALAPEDSEGQSCLECYEVQQVENVLTPGKFLKSANAQFDGEKKPPPAPPSWWEQRYTGSIEGQSREMASDEGAGREEKREAVRRALETLTPEEKFLYKRHFVRGWSYQQIGSRVGKSRPTVCRRMKNMLDRLRPHLQYLRPGIDVMQVRRRAKTTRRLRHARIS